MNPDKPLLKSKKALLAILGLGCIMGLALTGNGDAAAYGAIGIIVSVVCGGQAAVDFRKADTSYQDK